MLSTQGSYNIHPNYIPHSLLVAMGTDTTVHIGFLAGTSAIRWWAGLGPALYHHMTHLVHMPQAYATPLDKFHVSFL